MKKYSWLERLLLSSILTAAIISMFLPLLVLDQFLYPYVFPRTAIFRVLTLLAAVAYATLIALNPSYRPRLTPLTGALSLFTGTLVVTAITGVDLGHSFWSSVERSEGLLLWVHLLLFYVVITSAVRPEEWRNLFRAATIAGWLQITYAIGQYLHAPFALITSGERLSGAVGNPSFLAAYLIFIIGMGLWLYHHDTQRAWRMSYLALIAASIVIILYTQTRGAVLGLAVGSLWYLYRAWQHYPRRLRAGVAALLFAIIAVSGLIIAIPQSQSVILQHETVARYTNLNPDDITVSNRLIVWGVGWRAFLERPLWGWGIENFHIPFSTYFDPAISRDIGSNSWYDRAHNTLVEIGVGAGLLGLMAYLAVWIAAMHAIDKPRPNERAVAKAAMGAMLIAYFIQNLFVFDTLSSYSMLVLTLAYLNTFHRATQHPQQDAASAQKPPAVGAALSGAVTATLAAFIIVMTVIEPARTNYATLSLVRTHRENPQQGLIAFRSALTHVDREQEEYRFILAQFTRDSIRKQGLSSETIPLLQYTVDELEKTIETNPDTLQLYLLAAELYLDARDYREDFLERAAAHAQKAIALSPTRFQPYTTLARIRAAQQNYGEAITLLTKATQLNDRFAEGFWNLSIAYILSGNHAKAQEALAAAEERGYPVYTQENVKKLLGAYVDAKNLENMIAFLNVVTARLPELTEYQTLRDDLERGFATLYPTSTNAIEQ